MTSHTGADAFFDYARERYAVYLRRVAGEPAPWTQDPILQSHRFCNVYRELDRTTQWFRRHVRDSLRDKPEVLLATVVFRWFNRITTGEAIFCQTRLDTVPPGATAWDEFLGSGDVRVLGEAVRAHCGPKGPYVTGSYTINTRSAGLGLTKLEGVLKLIEMWLDKHPEWREYALQCHRNNGKNSLEAFCEWAAGPCLGPFMTYEVACDLRYTALLENAPDRLTWANLGPGAKRGLNRVYFREDYPVESPITEAQALKWMSELLQMSRDARFWPQGGKVDQQRAKNAVEWPRWEMREVEHTLCEFDKYERVRRGQGRPRGTFNGRGR